MSDWHSLVGTFGQMAGTAGTVTLPMGACVLVLSVHSSANASTFQLFNGPPAAVINGAATLVYEFPHLLVQANSSNGGQIVFTNTDHYYIQYVQLRH